MTGTKRTVFSAPNTRSPKVPLSFRVNADPGKRCASVPWAEIVISAVCPALMLRSSLGTVTSIWKVRVTLSAEREMKLTSPRIRRPSTNRASAAAPSFTCCTAISGTNPTSLMGSNCKTVAQRPPGCKRLPNSAVSVSKMPSKEACMISREISFCAKATAAAAD